MNGNRLIANKYRLERLLGRGGMGEVWSARHVELESLLAVKLQLNSTRCDRASERRFRREARAAAELRSPHVLHIYDYGVDNELPYIAMEYLEGENLRERLLRCGRLSLSEGSSLLTQAARGLEVAHQRGIVHRDIKPSNLFLATCGGEEVLKIVDFGIAKAGGDLAETTSTGTVMGSPAYLSPEQALGHSVDHRSDVWSLAVVLFRMLTGEEAFGAPSVPETMSRICSGRMATPSSIAIGLSRDVDRFFERALNRDLVRRFQSAHALAEGFARIAQGYPDCVVLGRDAGPGIATNEAGEASRSMSTKSLEPATAPKHELARRRYAEWRHVALAFLAALALLAVQAASAGDSNSRGSPGFAPASVTEAPAPQMTISSPVERELVTAIPSAMANTVPRPPERDVSPLARRHAPYQLTQRRAEDVKPTSSAPRIDPIFGIPTLVTFRGANAVSSGISPHVLGLDVPGNTGRGAAGGNGGQ